MVVGDYIEVFFDDCVYIIYIFGIIGNFKGVCISYWNLDIFMRNLIDKKLYYLFDLVNRYLVFVSISFDVFILELMMCILVGGILILVGEDECRDIFLLDELIRCEKVNIVFFFFLLLGMFVDFDFLFFKILFFGVEVIGEKLFNRLK